MPISVIDNFEINAPKNIDQRLGPYASVEEATGSIEPLFRYVGMTVTITGSGYPVDYWFSPTTANSDLKVKTAVTGEGAFITTGSNGQIQGITGSLIVTGSITGSLYGTASYSMTASYAENAGTSVSYVTTSLEPIAQIEVADYTNDVAVDYNEALRRLKFIFGVPSAAETPTIQSPDYATNKFNNEPLSYSLICTFKNNGYTLISASLYSGSTELQKVGSGTSFTYNVSTTGNSQTYKLIVTSSNPATGVQVIKTATETYSLNKQLPDLPTINATPNVQLGTSLNQIEEGATGSISFTPSYGSNSNGWQATGLVTDPVSGILSIATGMSADLTISATANYQSPGSSNIPPRTTSRSITRTYTDIRSLRYGYTDTDITSTMTLPWLHTLTNWDADLSGDAVIDRGRIVKGTVNPNGYTLTVNPGTISGTDRIYQYIWIIIDSKYTLTSLLSTTFQEDLPIYIRTEQGTVGNGYYIYRVNTPKYGAVTYTVGARLT